MIKTYYKLNRNKNIDMKKNSFWNIIINSMTFQSIVAGFILIVVLVLILGKAILNWISN
mgnify:CR=1 FL=1